MSSECGKVTDGDGARCVLPAGHDPNGAGQACCPGPECWACRGEACWKCGAGLTSGAPHCDHGVLERHEEMSADVTRNPEGET